MNLKKQLFTVLSIFINHSKIKLRCLIGVSNMQALESGKCHSAKHIYFHRSIDKEWVSLTFNCVHLVQR